jgi:hypothetical protein
MWTNRGGGERARPGLARAVRGLLGAAAVALTLWPGGLEASAAEATAAELLRDPMRFAGHLVSVRGRMGAPQTLPSRRAAVTIFDLTDGGALVKVIALVRPTCFPGSVVTVDGRFDPVKTVEGLTFVNVLDASVVRCR